MKALVAAVYLLAIILLILGEGLDPSPQLEVGNSISYLVLKRLRNDNDCDVFFLFFQGGAAFIATPADHFQISDLSFLV